jgi:hypothetical protein
MANIEKFVGKLALEKATSADRGMTKPTLKDGSEFSVKRKIAR